MTGAVVPAQLSIWPVRVHLDLEQCLDSSGINPLVDYDGDVARLVDESDLHRIALGSGTGFSAETIYDGHEPVSGLGTELLEHTVEQRDECACEYRTHHGYI
ncbi:hypothetical protein OHA72_56185 [Dactylosporangium sp. NBC_01737]|uniref:hypothetical protein n=1 Tax=Dactylosporangium sp. NBC_01737 TaxID=2975959 RepID=UPI002E15A91F|nr:hypothetical protein OHA72_56185 [Dactylosporangium sp. NBC_01737]